MTIKFGKEYYEKVMEEYGYDPLEFERINFSIKGFSVDDLQHQWLCHSGGKDFTDKLDMGVKSIVTTGFGLSGPPHMGTVSQIMRAIRFQQKGLSTQIVLGDLDAFNGKMTEFSYTQELAHKYKEFIKNLGFIENENNILRSQFNSLHTLRTSYLLGHFLEDDMFLETEEDLHEFYTKHGKVDSEMSYRRKLSLNLMIADFYDLAIKKGFENVLVFLGIDEHKYVRLAQKLIKKTQDYPSLDINISISALYSSIIRGFNGFPKMSKSFPDSGITLNMSNAEIKDRVLNQEGNYSCPEDNVVYQMIASASFFNEKEIKEAYYSCLDRSPKWEKFKIEYAEQLNEVCAKWPLG
ncbi:hypothetical protein [Bacillus pseudomycoides]|uniref:hypothetical protein n=1 Tax=Bacillus pseudomycoides TaxID=64104 RepID=UPI000BEC693E|nr:hypothetical protein [Bacillus pseudomycoides]PDZ70804.1 hypothetical protein CON58_26930 [Bacillus pseudomycoides]